MEGPQQSRANKLLSMSRQQLSVVIDLLTAHLGLYGHLHKIGKDINPLCRRCLNGNGTAEHEQAATIHSYWSTHSTSWPIWSFS